MKKVCKLALALSVPALLSACAQDIVATAANCGSWQDIRISKDDVLTDGTATQIEGNNLARDAVCKSKPKT